MKRPYELPGAPPPPARPPRPHQDETQSPEVSKATLRRATRERKRFERGEVRRFTRRSRRRRLVWWGSLGAAALLVGGATLTAFSPLLALHNITVLGTHRLDPAAVTRALDDQLGRPLPLVDAAAVKADLAPFALIRSYSVESHPPGSLVVRVVEREPVAVLHEGDEYRLVDPAGIVIASSKTRPGTYPLVTAAAARADAGGGFAAAAAVLADLPPKLLAEVDEVTAASKDDVTFTLRKGGARVVWGGPEQAELKSVVLADLMAAPGADTVSYYDVSSPTSPVTR